MQQIRRAGYGIMLNATHWWLTGGNHATGESKTSEIYNFLTNTSSFFFDLPIEGSVAHTIVKWNETHYVMCGLSKKFFIVDITVGAPWTQLPDSTNYHTRSMCGKVTAENGTEELVIAGGTAGPTTEIYNMASNTWRFGNDIPGAAPLNNAFCLADNLQQSFFCAGGQSGSGPSSYTSRVVYFNRTTYDWDVVAHMSHPLMSVSGTMVSSDFVNCN